MNDINLKTALGFPSMSDQDLGRMLAARSSQSKTQRRLCGACGCPTSRLPSPTMREWAVVMSVGPPKRIQFGRRNVLALARRRPATNVRLHAAFERSKPDFWKRRLLYLLCRLRE